MLIEKEAEATNQDGIEKKCASYSLLDGFPAADERT